MDHPVYPITKESMLPFVGYGVDDACSACTGADARRAIQFRKDGLACVRMVGFRAGFEPMVVAVWSYLPSVRLDDDEATELAVDLLRERGWFADPEDTAPDFVL